MRKGRRNGAAGEEDEGTEEKEQEKKETNTKEKQNLNQWVRKEHVTI